jgi:AraC-like DNA-binding protein
MNVVVKDWLKRFKKYFFSIRDGFFELPVLGNSPELMMDSFTSLPFMKNHTDKSYYQTNNIFVKGEAHYQKIEEGLWLIVSDLEIKKNLSFKLYYLENEPSDYHFLTLYIDKISKEVKLPELHLDVENINHTWTWVKAGSKCLNTHLKDQESLFLNFYISTAWIEQNVATSGMFKNNKLQTFFESSSEHIFLHSLINTKKEVYEKLIQDILTREGNRVRDFEQMKSRAYELIGTFVETLDNGPDSNFTCPLPERDRRRVFYAKYLIDKAVFQKFPSISSIAKQVGTSETKVKADFKSLMGKSMLQYYIQQQMMYATEMIKQDNLSIKVISQSLGYSSPSKFTEAFKKYYGFLPSELLQY